MPWLKVDKEGTRKGRLLGSLLKVPGTQGIGIVTSLWEWALEIAPEGDFSGSIPDLVLMAAACEWATDDAPRLAVELQRLGLIATTPGLRVRGLDRYRSAWEKNRRRNGKPTESGSSPAQPPYIHRAPAPEPERQKQNKTQTQTQTQELQLQPVDQGRPDPAVEVFEHWRSVMETPRSLFTPDRRRAVEARLKEGRTVDELKQAVDGCKLTPHNMGENDRGEKFNDLELICRKNANVERFMRNAAAPPKPHVDIRKAPLDGEMGEGPITATVKW